MLTLIDSHVHLDDARFDSDREAIIARARAAGVAGAIVPAVAANTWPKLQALSQTHPELYPAYGLHPLFLEQHRPAHMAALQAWLAHHPAVALGEIGLDYFNADLDRALQLHYFAAQLKLARDYDLPVILHARRALDPVIAQLRRIGGLRGVVHSFSGSEEQARQLSKLGFYLGIGGPVTYPRAQRLRRIVASMPIDELLLETDAPDQPTVSHRGQRNEPACLLEIAQCIAELRGVPLEAIAHATTANARRLFRLNPG